MPFGALLLLVSLSSLSCSFDYGANGEGAEGRPDIVMGNFEFVQVADRHVRVRLQGEQAERWETSQRMLVEQPRFVQYAGGEETPSATGSAGKAVMQLDSGDIVLAEGVQLYLESEKTLIESGELHWYDDSLVLLSPDDSYVLVKDVDGSLLSGRGFGADIRRRTWEFVEGLSGSYVMETAPDSPDKSPLEDE